jgi:hypothetical protein
MLFARSGDQCWLLALVAVVLSMCRSTLEEVVLPERLLQHQVVSVCGSVAVLLHPSSFEPSKPLPPLPGVLKILI